MWSVTNIWEQTTQRLHSGLHDKPAMSIICLSSFRSPPVACYEACFPGKHLEPVTPSVAPNGTCECVLRSLSNSCCKVQYWFDVPNSLWSKWCKVMKPNHREVTKEMSESEEGCSTFANETKAWMREGRPVEDPCADLWQAFKIHISYRKCWN